MWHRNSHRLRSDVGSIEHIVLSHYHRDHSGKPAYTEIREQDVIAKGAYPGGLVRAIELIQQSNEGNRRVAMDMHPNRPDFRGVQADIPISLEADPSFDEILDAGATVLKSDQPHTVLDDFFLVSGEIPRETPYEDGIYGGLRYDTSKGKWEEDTLIMDERYVMCNLKGTNQPVMTLRRAIT